MPVSKGKFGQYSGWRRAQTDNAQSVQPTVSACQLLVRHQQWLEVVLTKFGRGDLVKMLAKQAERMEADFACVPI
jgi:hypothetical protein